MDGAPLNDEWLDVVDENDKVVGRELRSVLYSENRSDFRVVNAFIRNSKGELWIPRRTAGKRLFPSCLDVSMGGHVGAGETYDEAFRRELMEELRIPAESTSYKVLGRLSPRKDGVSAFMTVYEIESDDVPDLNPEDFSEYFWLMPEEVIGRLALGDRSKDDLPRLIAKFYAERVS